MAQTKRKTANESITLQRNWGWLLGLGVLFVILGFIGLGMVVSLTLASMLFLGILLLIAGVAQFIDVFQAKTWNAVVWHGFIAALYVVGGALVIYDPLIASTLITVLLGSVLLIIGITRIIMGINLKGAQGANWVLFAGIVTMVLGLMILLSWPFSGLWFIGLYIAIEMMIVGWTYVFLALGMRTA